MKIKKSKSCPVCGQKFSPQGLVNHLKFAHKDAAKKESVHTTGGPFFKVEEPVANKIVDTAVQDALRYMGLNAAEPFQYAVLSDFEEAVRRHEMKGSYEPGTQDAVEEDYKRAKRLLALRILLLKTRADLADTLERELLS